jgi:transposase
MLPRSSPFSQLSRRIGVGIDTSRYGHYAAFVRDDLQPAAAELQFAESAAGYGLLRQRLEQIAQRHGAVEFVVRLDAAGQYADNLLHYLQRLGEPAPAGPLGEAPSALGDASRVAYVISCGDPQRNKNYRAALFGGKKSDPVEARACARFAVTERPAAVKPMATELRTLRQVAARLQAVVRQRTRLINQFHHLLALTFPELAMLVHDLAAGWVLELVHRYPAAPLLAQAATHDLENVPYLPHDKIDSLLSHARSSIGSLGDDAVVELVHDQVRQLRDCAARQKRLENLLVSAYRRLPELNHLDTIPGIGAVTAAVLTAFILDIDRFDSPAKLVAYFGVLPIEAASGVDRDGKPRGPKRYVMSRRGNDLVRRYLWMAALSAVRHNPAVRALYARVVAKNPDHKGKAIGHGMRKLLHLAFAIWKTQKPFDAQHYSWATPTHVEVERDVAELTQVQATDARSARSLATSATEKAQAAGLKSPVMPVLSEVTTACEPSLPHHCATDDHPFVDFAHVKRQLPMARVLDQLGLTARLRGKGPQQRCTCPIHRGDARGRTFSVHLEQGVFQCFDARCGAKGDVIDLWASVKGMSLRNAALDLIATFNLEAAPRKGTGKRNG